MDGTSIFISLRSKCCRHAWMFGTFWTNPWNLHLSIQIQKCWRSIKDATRRLYPLLASIWRTTKLRTSRVAKDPRRRKRPFATFTKTNNYLIFFSFAANFLRARCKRATTWWTTSTSEMFADQLACLEVSVGDKDIVMTLFESSPASDEYLTTTIETRPMKELLINYVMPRLM